MSLAPSFDRLEIQSRVHTYDVLLGRGLLDSVGSEIAARRAFRAGSRCAVVTDDHVAPLYAGQVLTSLRESGFKPDLVVVASGEQSKCMTTVSEVAEQMISLGLDRTSFVVALGGGVVGDLAGFVASIYQRGLPYVQIPTTVVSQVDSAIGGKTGVNTVSGKNLLGAFHPPALVVADLNALESLPEREFNEGFAEIIKHGIIRDRALFERVTYFNRADQPNLAGIIRRNLEIKAEIVAADEHERLGTRALLNFGHTIGHGIEQAGGYGRFLHGEAVSLGMVAAARLSTRRAGLPLDDCEAIIQCLARFGLPVTLPSNVGTSSILSSLRRDKKFDSGAIRFVLATRIGDARLSEPGEVTEDDLRATIEGLRSPVDFRLLEATPMGTSSALPDGPPSI